MYYYLLYRNIDRKRKKDFLWFHRFDEKPTNLYEEEDEMFCLKIIESDSYDMCDRIMRETWPEINVLDRFGNLTYL